MKVFVAAAATLVAVSLEGCSGDKKTYFTCTSNTLGQTITCEIKDEEYCGIQNNRLVCAKKVSLFLLLSFFVM